MRQYRFFLLPFLFSLLSFPLFAQQTLNDTHPLAVYKKANTLFQNQKYAAAQYQYAEFAQQTEDELLKADALYHAAVCAIELFQEDAEAMFLTFLQEYPEHPRARVVPFQLSRFYFRQNNYRSAIKWLGEVDPYDLDWEEQAEQQFMQAYSNFKLKNYKAAKPGFQKLAQTENEYQELSRYYYGYLSFQDKEYEQALKSFLKMQPGSPFFEDVPAFVMQIYLQTEQYQKATEYGDRILQGGRLEETEDLYMLLGEAHFRLENWEQAVRYLRQYQEEAYRMSPAQNYQLGYSLYKLSRFDEAVEPLEEAVKGEDSLAQHAAYHLGGAYLKTNQKLKARNAFLEASELEADPQITEASYFNYAKLSYENNFQREAIQALRQFISEYPNSEYADEAKTVLGDILYSTRNYREALTIMEEIPQRNRQMNEAYQKIAYYYGQEQFQSRRYQAAEALFQKSLSVNANDRISALANFWLGETAYQQGQLSEAYEHYRKFLFKGESKRTPYYALAYYNMGYSLFEQGKYDQALPYFKRYLELEKEMTADARYYDAILRTADTYFAQKQYKDAVQYYERIIKANRPSADYALYQKGIIQGLLGEVEEKVTLLTRLINQYPKSPYVDDAYFEIANTHFVAGQFAQARQEFLALNEAFPKSPYYRLSLLKIGLIHYNQQEDDQAMRYFTQIVQQYPYSVEAREALGSVRNIYTDRGEADSLIAFMRTIPDANLTMSFQDSIKYEAAFSQLRRGDCGSAIPAFEDYLAKFPSGYFSINAHYYLGDCYARQNIDKKALKHYEFVIDRSPNFFVENATHEAATLYFQREQYREALQKFRLLEEIATGKTETLDALAGQMRSYMHLNQPKEAQQVANQVLRLSFAPEQLQQEAKFVLAQGYLQQNNLNLAIDLFSEVAKTATGEMGAEAAYQIAYIQYLQEQYDTAQTSVLALRDNFSNHPFWVAKGYILLADIFTKMGDDFQARHTLQSIINNYEGEELGRIAREKLEALKARTNQSGGQQKEQEQGSEQELEER